MVDNSNDIEKCTVLIHNHFEKRGSSCENVIDDSGARSKEYNNGFVTVLLGAGASASIGTDGLIKSLIEKHEDMFNINTIVNFGSKLENCTLEQLLSIYSQIYNDNETRKFLTGKKILSRDDNIRPTEGYEFLAHLVRHNLVNNIITTNFDEEPEISLDDEIGQSNYRILKSLSEFDAFNMEIEMERERAERDCKIINEINIIKKPIFLKVHGTISYPLTIRATIENVKKFEEQKRKAIEWILCHTNILIIIGYSFKDKDLENAFKEALIRKGRRDHPDKMTIFWVHKTPSNRVKYENFLNAICRKKAIGDSINKPVSFITQNTNDFMRILCEKIEEKDRNIEITTIARQKLRILLLDKSYVFSLNDNEINDEKLSKFLNKNNSNCLMQPFSIEYDEEESAIIIKSKFGEIYKFMARKEIDKLTIYREFDPENIIRDKFYIEVIIFALTVKGLFSLDALTDYIRVQRYCGELLSDKDKPTPRELLGELIN